MRFVCDVDPARHCLTVTHRFHNVWEFWAYNVVFGLFQAPYYAFSQTMMAELTPPGFDNMVRPPFLPSVLLTPADPSARS